MFKRYRKASQSPIPSWATNQQVLIIFFCAFRNKGEGAHAISDLVQRENNGTGYWIVNVSDSYFGRQQYVIYCSLYNSPSYSRILIGPRLWSIRGQMHDWRHHYRVFPSAVLKWRKVLRIGIIFYVTREKIRYKKALPRHWTGSRSQRTKDKAVSFRKWYRNNFLAASVGSRARLNHALKLGLGKPRTIAFSRI